MRDDLLERLLLCRLWLWTTSKTTTLTKRKKKKTKKKTTRGLFFFREGKALGSVCKSVFVKSFVGAKLESQTLLRAEPPKIASSSSSSSEEEEEEEEEEDL